MNSVKATWKNGQIVPDGPVDWPEGRRLVVLEQPPVEIDFMTEDDQGDDPSLVQRWVDELRAIPPLPMSQEQEAEMLAWRQQVKEFNLQAVRQQMAEGIQ